MSTSAGQGPEFAIAPGQYHLAAMEELVNHPDLQGQTIPEHALSLALPAFVALGHVAIASEDNEAYDAWLAHTTNFVQEVQARDFDTLVEYYDQHVAKLQFYGVEQGRVDIADKLHEHLAATDDYSSVHGIVKLCAQHEISPQVWIEKHLTTADDRIYAWAQYFSEKRAIVSERYGRELTVEEMQVPGSQQVIKDVVGGALTERGVIDFAQTAYELALHVETKKRIIDRYEMALTGRFGGDVDDGTLFDQEYAFRFATKVMSDPEMPQDVKMYLYNQTVTHLGGWEVHESWGGRGRLEIARAIELGEDVQAVLQMLEGKAQEASPMPAIQDRYRNTFTLVAAQLYADHGQFEQSAAQLSRLNTLPSWRDGLVHYVQKGGDVSLVRQADAERYAFDVAMYGEQGAESEDENRWWNTRLLMAEFFEHIGQTPDHQKARENLLKMAEDIGNNPERDGDVTRSRLLQELTQRLLVIDPTAIAIGPELVARIGQSDELLPLFEMFAQHGSREMTAAGWEYVNRPRQRAERAWYLRDYVGMLLASKALSSEV